MQSEISCNCQDCGNRAMNARKNRRPNNGRGSVKPRQGFMLAVVAIVPCLLGKGKTDKPTPYVVSVTVGVHGSALRLKN